MTPFGKLRAGSVCQGQEHRPGLPIHQAIPQVHQLITVRCLPRCSFWRRNHQVNSGSRTRRTRCASSRRVGEPVLACPGFRHLHLSTEFLTVVRLACPSLHPEPSSMSAPSSLTTRMLAVLLPDGDEYREAFLDNSEQGQFIVALQTLHRGGEVEGYLNPAPLGEPIDVVRKGGSAGQCHPVGADAEDETWGADVWSFVRSAT